MSNKIITYYCKNKPLHMSIIQNQTNSTVPLTMGPVSSSDPVSETMSGYHLSEEIKAR